MIIDNFDKLIEMWEEDSKLDITEISKETSEIGKLHSKYNGIRTQHRLKMIKAKADYDRMVGLKRSYYKGELSDPDILKKYGWDQWVHNKVLNSNMAEVLASDEDLITLNLKKSTHEEIVSFCEYVLKEINNRTWQCKTIFESERYFSGG